jgi:hypothetical protein
MRHLNRPSRLALAGVLVGATLVGGCATDPEEADDTEFGASVRHMIATQTYEPGTETGAMDGEKAQAGLAEYRKDVARPKEAERPLIRMLLGR